MSGLFAIVANEEPQFLSSSEQNARDAAASAQAAASSAESANIANTAAQSAAVKSTQIATQVDTQSSIATQAATDSRNYRDQTANNLAQVQTIKTSVETTQTEVNASAAQVKTDATTSASNAQAAKNSADASASSATAARQSVADAVVQVNNAKTQATASAASATLARDWAIRMDGKVSNDDYSAKYYAAQAKNAVTGVISFNGRQGEVVPQAGDYTPAQIGALPLTGGSVTGEVISTSTGGNNFRMAINGKSTFQRLDNSNLYFMVSDTATGTYNNLRPLSINISTGTVTLGNGATVSNGNLNVSTNIIVSGTITSVGNITTNNTVLASDMRAGAFRVVNSPSNSELNFSNNGNGYIQINRANIAYMDGGGMPLMTMGPMHVASVAGALMNRQGTHLTWNETGDGRGAIVVNPGAGTGGFNFRFINNANTIETGSVRMDQTGTLRASNDIIAVNRVMSGNGAAHIAADGNINGPVWGGYINTWISNNFYPRSSGDGAYARANDAWSKANDAQLNRVQWVRTGSRGYSDYMGNSFRNVEAPSGHVMLGLNANGSSLDATRIIYGRIQVFKDNGQWMDSAY